MVVIGFHCCYSLEIMCLLLNMNSIAGPDLALGKLGSCPQASTTRGPPHVLSPFVYFFDILE